MRNLNPRQLEAFRTVVLTGGMTTAGECLHISQPAISRLIRDLEEAVGLRLFVRRGNQLVATTEGLLLYREIERCFVSLEQISRTADEIRHLKAGSLRIAAMPAFALGYLTKVVRAFMNEHPRVSITIHSDSSQNVLDLISGHHFDMGIGANPMERPGIEAVPLPTLEAVCVLPRHHPLAKSKAVHVEALQNEPVILLGKNSHLRYRLDSLMRSANIKCDLRLESTLGTTICAFVSQGLGLSVIDPYTAAHLGGPQIICRPFRPVIPYESSIVYSSYRPRAKLAEEFSRLLQESIVRDFGATDSQQTISVKRRKSTPTSKITKEMK